MLSWIATTQAAVQAAPANIAPQVLEAVAVVISKEQHLPKVFIFQLFDISIR